MQRTNWLDRKFNFDFPTGLLPNVTARLAGTLPRLNHIVLNLSEEKLKQKPDGKWSIKEHIGHLSKTEDLHQGRIDDIIARKDVLHPAGFKNLEGEPDYNQINITELLSMFEVNRKRFITRLQALDDETQNTSSLHPRLQTMMRPVDIAYFAAEHDDHHIASIYEILKNLKV